MMVRRPMMGLAMALAMLAATFTPLTPAASASVRDRRTAIVESVEKSRGGIVNIRTMRFSAGRVDDVGGQGQVRGLGTGVIIDPRGYVVTNHHVVDAINEVEVVTADGEVLTANVLVHDERHDLAVLRVTPRHPLPYLELGDAEAILGETVIAIGNPYGLENTVTVGICSAVHRRLRLPNGEFFDDLIQTDASINPGNSGGPLLNVDGELLGLNVAIRKEAQGIGFAIPASKVRGIVDRLMRKRARLLSSSGLHVESRPSSGALRPAGVAEPPGRAVYVATVEPDSPAAKLGFQAGDEVVRLDDQPVRQPFDVQRVLWDRSEGEQLDFQIRRAGESTKIRWVLPRAGDADLVWMKLGIRTEHVPAAVVKPIFERLNGGLRIIEIDPNGPAAQAGMKRGDILFGLHEWEMLDNNNIRFVMQWGELSRHQPIRFHIIRDSASRAGSIQMPSL